MKLIILLLPALLLAYFLKAAPVDEYMKSLSAMDDNMVSKSRRLNLRMFIKDNEGRRNKELEVVGKGYFTALARTLAPARDKGTKMLRLQKKKKKLLYLCLPETSRVIRLSGHMLRQSVMGSDLSFEDLLDAPRLGDNYEIIEGKMIKIEGRECYDLRLRALNKKESYRERRLVIEKARHVPVLQELYARGGKLLKLINYSVFEQFGDRYYPTKFTVRDKLRRDSSTTLEFFNVEFDIKLPRGAFTRRYLEREW